VPRCDSDGACAPTDGELADGDVVPMHRVPRVGPEWRFRWSSAASVNDVAVRARLEVSPEGDVSRI
jgi:hypothetical protein